MDTSKTVDVVMCTYNGEKFLREQLDSIVSQTYPISRLIVQDDRSTDGTVAIVREYAARHPFIELYVNPENLGYNLNFKTAVKRATADFVALADQDDIWLTDKIERQVAAIGPCNLCSSAYTRSRDMGNAYEVHLQHTLKGMFFSNLLGHTMLLRRDFAQLDRVWQDGIVYDYWLAVNAFFVGDHAIKYIDRPLNWHRDHDNEAGTKRHTGTTGTSEPPRQGKLDAYLHGLKHYRRLQSKPQFRRLCAYIYENTGSPKHSVEHRMARCLLSPGPLPLLRLCLICMRYRHEAYPRPDKTKGAKGLARGFFTPFIVAYGNRTFDK